MKEVGISQNATTVIDVLFEYESDWEYDVDSTLLLDKYHKKILCEGSKSGYI